MRRNLHDKSSKEYWNDFDRLVCNQMYAVHGDLVVHAESNKKLGTSHDHDAIKNIPYVLPNLTLQVIQRLITTQVDAVYAVVGDNITYLPTEEIVVSDIIDMEACQELVGYANLWHHITKK